MFSGGIEVEHIGWKWVNYKSLLKVARDIFIKNLLKKGGIISENFTVGFKIISLLIYVCQKE